MFFLKSLLSAGLLAMSVSSALAGPFGFDLKKNPLEVYPGAEEAIRIYDKTGKSPGYCDENPIRENSISCHNLGKGMFSGQIFGDSFYLTYKEGKGVCNIFAHGKTSKYEIVWEDVTLNIYDLVEVSLGLPTTLADRVARQFRKKYGLPKKTEYKYFDDDTEYEYFDDDPSKVLESIVFFWYLGRTANHGIESIHMNATNPDPDEKSYYREDSILDEGRITVYFTTNYC